MDFIGPDAFVATQIPPPLADDEIHLWFFPQWIKTDGGTVMSPLVLGLLARYVGVAPDALKIEHTASGKPFLVASDVHFNASHSGNVFLLGISRNQPLGVDVETNRRPRRVLDLAKRFFSPSETDALREMPQDSRLQAFLNLWSCKEAVLKAHGTGISFGLHRVTFELNAQGQVARLRAIDPAAGTAEHWHLRRVAPLPESTGALAWRGLPKLVRAFTAARA